MDEVKLKVIVDDVLDQIFLQGHQVEVMRQCVAKAQSEIDAANYLYPLVEDISATQYTLKWIEGDRTEALPQYERSGAIAAERLFEYQTTLGSLQKICPHTNNTILSETTTHRTLRCDLCTLVREVEIPLSERVNTEGENQA